MTAETVQSEGLAEAFVRQVARLTHTGDDGNDWSDLDDAAHTLDGLIAKAREIQSAPLRAALGEALARQASPSPLPEGQDLAELKLGEPDGPLTPRTTYWRDRAQTAEATITSLEAQLARAREALGAAEKALRSGSAQFRKYADLHKAKGTTDGDAKAVTNVAYAWDLETAANSASEVFTSLSEKGEEEQGSSVARAEGCACGATDEPRSAGTRPICLIPNCGRACPPDEAFCSKHRGAEG